MGKKILKTIGITVLLLVIGAVGFFTYQYLNINNKIVETKDKQKTENSTTEEIAPITDGITNILIMGMDNKTNDEIGRSDSMFILTIDKNRDKVKLTAINRDSYVKVYEENDRRKITEIAAVYGKKVSQQTVEETFGVPISGYISTDFKGFEKIIDAMGGVDMTINLTQDNLALLNSATTNKYDNGLVHFNGADALQYSRIRHADTTYARNTRQDEVLKAIAENLVKENILKNSQFLNILINYVKTNMDLSQILDIGAKAQMISISKTEYIEIPYQETRFGTIDIETGIWNLYFDRELTKQMFRSYINEDKKPDFTNVKLKTNQEIVDSDK